MKWAGREGVSTPKIDHEHETKKKTSDRRIQSPRRGMDELLQPPTQTPAPRQPNPVVTLRGYHCLTRSSLTATWGYARHTPQADVRLTNFSDDFLVVLIVRN